MFTLIAALIAVAATAASYYQQKKIQKQAAKQANEMAAVQVSGHDSNRALYTVYGETLVGSTTVWKQVSNQRYGMTDPSFQNFSLATGIDLSGNANGKNNRYLYRMVALCNGPIESVTNVVIDGEGYNAARFGVKETNLHFAAATYRGETAGATLNNLVLGFPQTSSMKGQEVAYAVERCYLHKSAPAFQGEPSTQYIVKGRKIYDPRKDSTSAYYNAALGVATHRSATPTTWQWSDNPSLCLLDYLHSETYGRGLDYTDIDLASFVSAATKCEVQVTVPARLTNTTGNTITIIAPMFGINEEVEVDATLPSYRTDQSAGNTQNRYRLNLAVDGSADVLDNVQKILNCFKGNLIFANGKYTVTLDDVASPVLSLNNDDIIGGLKITNGDRNQRVNRATVKFLNSNKDFKTDQVSWPAIDSSEYTAYLVEDQNEKLHKTYTVEGCVDFYQAEDTAEYLVRDSRVTTTVSGKFGPRALGLVPGDVVSLTYDSGGYVGTYFRVNQVALDVTTLEVTLQLREYDSSVYTWNASKGNEPLGLSWGQDAFNLEPGAPTLGTISHAVITSGDGSSVVQVTVPFSDVPDEADSVAVAWSLQNADTFTTILMPDAGAQTSAVFIAPSDDATYTVELRYFITNLNGRVFPSATATSDYVVPAITGTKLDGISTGATRNVVYQQATEPTGGTYNTNDTWIDTDDLKQYFWDGAAWTAFSEGDASAALAAAAAAEAAADGKIEVFYSNDAPSGLGEKEGDLWFDLNDGNKLYRYESSAWVLARDTGIAAAVQAAASADAKADGKVTTFFAASTSVPTALSVGDLWWTTDTNKFYRATAAGDDQITAGEWELTDIVATSIDNQGDLATSPATEADVLNSGLDVQVTGTTVTIQNNGTNTGSGTSLGPINVNLGWIEDLQWQSSTSCVLTKNAFANGTADNGEVRVQAGKLKLQDGTVRTLSADGCVITNMETVGSGIVGVRYIVWGNGQAFGTGGRFPTLTTDSNNLSSSNAGLFLAYYDFANSTWKAEDNSANEVAFTPADDDVVIAQLYRSDNSFAGIERLQMISTQVTDPEATVGATWGTDVGSLPANLSGLTGTEGIENANIDYANDGTGILPVANTEATVGATWGTDVGSLPANLSALVGTEGINNLNINYSTDGSGILPVANTEATVGATWGADVGSLPANLSSLVGTEGILNLNIDYATDGSGVLPVANTNSTVVSGAASGATANQDSTATIQAGTTAANVGLGSVSNITTATMMAQNHTGSVNGTAASTVVSGAASGATANQDSTATIQAGTTAANVGLGSVSNITTATMMAQNHTGSVNGTAASTVVSGAASGATANQSSNATIQAGTTKANVGLGSVPNYSAATMMAQNHTGSVNGTAASTVVSGAASGATANQSSNATIRGGISINASGDLIGAGGGSVTASGLGASTLNGVVTANMAIRGSSIVKVSGAGSWNGGYYSKEGFVGGCIFSAKVYSTGQSIMLGLNRDASNSSSYTNIDYALYQTASNNLNIYESGSSIGQFATGLVVGDEMAVSYNGRQIQYWRNGTLLRSVNLSTADRFYADASLVGGGLKDLSFLPIGNILSGNVTGNVNGTAASTVVSGAASGATANQSSNATIQAGTTKANVGLGSVPNYSAATMMAQNHTGSVNGTAASTVVSGAASGATANQSSNATIRNGVTTYALDKAASATWSAIGDAGQISGPPSPYDVTIQWRNGSGTSLGTTVVRMSYTASGTSISTVAHTTQSNSASASVSLNSTNTVGNKITTITKNSVTVTLQSTIINGISWSFNK